MGGVPTGNEFQIVLRGPVCDIFWDIFVGTSVAVDDAGNAWSASTTDPGIMAGQYWVLEGYAAEGTGAGVRIYIEGTMPGPYTEFVYDDGSQVGMGPDTTLGILIPAVKSPGIIEWRDLTFYTT